jgi:hypothetical protein
VAENAVPTIPTVDDLAAQIAAVRSRMEEDDDFRHGLEEGRPSGNPIQLGPRLPDAKTWAQRQVKGAADAAQKWYDNTTKPRKNFKEEALKADAGARYNESMEEVIRENRWQGGMSLVDEGEAIRTIEAGGAKIYSEGVKRREGKIERRVDETRADRLAICSVIDALPTSTDGEREEKMIQNKRALQAMGKARRGG